MSFLAKLLLFPITGPVRGLQFILEQIQAEAEATLQNEGRIHASLIELSMRHEAGEISDADYEEEERALLAQLNAIRAYHEELLASQQSIEGEEQ